MVKVDVTYTGGLHCDATHGPSQSKISTDAPSDNKGKGEAFSPTDLVATALATCISTTMGIKAEDLGVDLRGMTVSVQKEMSKDGPRRIVALPSEVHIPVAPDHPHREVLEQTARNCPVHKSLPAEIHRPTKFFWEGK
jgi:putative redox protein